MADVLYLARSADTTTILWDFADADGSGNPAGLKTKLRAFDDGAPDVDLQLLNREVGDGDEVTAQRRGPRTVVVTDRIDPAASVDALFDGVGRLASILTNVPDLVLVRQFNGETERTYYPILAAPALPSIWNGGEVDQLDLVLSRFTQPEGFPIELLCQPWRYASEVDPALNLLPAGTLVIDDDDDGIPEGWAFDVAGGHTDYAINGEEMAFEFDLATGAVRKFEFLLPAGTFAVGDKLGWAVTVEQLTGPLDPVVVNAQMVFLQSNGTTAVGGNQNGATANLSALDTPTRVSVVSAAAGANTSRARVGLVFDGTTTTQKRMRVTLAIVTNLGASGSTVPSWRGGEQAVPNTSIDVPAGHRFLTYVDTDLPTPVSLEVEGDSGAQLSEVLAGVVSDYGVGGLGALTDHVNYTGTVPLDTSRRGWTITRENSTTLSGQVSAVSVGTSRVGTMLRRVVATRTTRLDSLRGGWSAFARLSTVSYDLWRLKLHYGIGTGDPAFIELDPVEYQREDPGASPQSDFGWVDLGHVFIPEDVPLDGARFEVFVERATGTGTALLNLRDLVLVPDRERALMFVPGASGETWLGKALDTSPVALSGETLNNSQINNAIVELNNVREAAGTPPLDGSGISLGTARQVFKFTCQGGPQWDGTATFRILDVTNVPAVLVASVSVSNRNGPKTIERELRFTSDPAKLYQAQVVVTVYGGGELKVQRIRRTSIPFVGSGEAFRTRPETGFVDKLSSAGGVVAPLGVKGPTPIVLGPGWHALTMLFAETALPGHPTERANDSRVPIVRATYAPRRY